MRKQKRIVCFWITIIVTTTFLMSAMPMYVWAMTSSELTDEQFLEVVSHKAFNYFWDHQDLRTGLFQFSSRWGDYASTGVTGFGLAALVIGAERGWVSKREAEDRALLAIDAFYDDPNDPNDTYVGDISGFFHGLYTWDPKPLMPYSISSLDTALLVAGALTAGEYFGGEIEYKAKRIYGRVGWRRLLEADPQSEIICCFIKAVIQHPQGNVGNIGVSTATKYC